jgi:hypothetical protein
VHAKHEAFETRSAYGWPRTCKELLDRGIRMGKNCGNPMRFEENWRADQARQASA